MPAHKAIRKPYQIFVNRNLRLDSITHVGFDMDYTLAVYRKERIERLAFQETIKKLVEMKYPEEILSLKFDPHVMIRGLVIDKKLGNILKMDRFGYVGRAYHGMRPMSDSERVEAYSSRRIRISDQRYHSVDTLFDLPETHLYAQLVTFLDCQSSPGVPDYWQVFDDTRASLDLSHQDGSIKRPIMKEPERYVIRDRSLALALDRLHEVGKKVFVCTNSEWEYTDRLMQYMLGGALGEYGKWTAYFDRIMVGSRKPDFFTRTDPFFNLEGKPLVLADLHKHKFLIRGNSQDFQKIEGARGEQILYIGDHIYGDILRSKKTHGWRTTMIVEELEHEIQLSHRARTLNNRLKELDLEAHLLDHDRNRLQRRIDSIIEVQKGGGATRRNAFLVGWSPERKSRALDSYGEKIKVIDAQVAANLGERETLQQAYDSTFNSNWGPLMKEKNEISRFGQQVKNYACLYTGRVTNFLSYSTDKVFRSPIDLMPHDHGE